MKILVTYGSGSGATQGIAAWITDELTRLGAEAALVDCTLNPSPATAEAVFVGSGIHAGHWLSSAVNWLDEYAAELRRIPVAAYTSSLGIASGGQKAVEYVVAETAATLEPVGITPIATAAFAGAYDPTKVKLSERIMMKAMHQEPCDLRDEATVRTWTRQTFELIEATYRAV